jgi:DNA helicase II / ATP-dependent DNA helicase PcrA
MLAQADPTCRSDRLLDALNVEQRQAATHGVGSALRSRGGPLLVIAGAGTGKTTMLAHRVAQLVLAGADAQRIALLTFSRRAAQTLSHRAGELVAQALAAPGASAAPSARVHLPWAGTFHSVGAKLLRLHAEPLGLAADFSILDRADAADLIDLIRHEQGLSTTAQRFPRKDTCLAIYSHRVNTGAPLAQVLATLYPWCSPWHDALMSLFRGYVARKQAQALMDYDDLLVWWDAAMSDLAFARSVGDRFDHLLVDEYQDTNRLQSRILKALKPDGCGLTVVGDDAQSIYSFRAADVGNILDFERQFDPPATRVTLTRNYRSVQPVLDAANALMSQAQRGFAKTLHAHRGDGARPRLVTVADEPAQARWVCDRILAQREAGIRLKDQAVLFRSAHHSDLLEVELTRRNIPYVKHGGLRFLQAAHVKDVLAVLRWADNPRHALAGFRTLQLVPGIGPTHAHRCLAIMASCKGAAAAFDQLSQFKPPAPAKTAWPVLAQLMQRLSQPQARWAGQFEQVLHWYGPLLEQRNDDAQARLADLQMLATIADACGSRERFLTELALDPPSAAGDLAGDPRRDEDYLILSTVHSAKGQEWDSVFVINVADGNFPNEYATGRPELIEEERRLLYVAMTRARDTLFLIEPLRYYVTQQPREGAAHVYAARSRFLSASVLSCLDRIAGGPRTEQTADRDALEPEPAHKAPSHAAGAPTGILATDIAARIRATW